MAMRRCLGRCGRMIETGSYCSACRPRNGSTRAWRTLRAAVLYRDAYRCALCLRQATEVDHIQRVIDGGTDPPPVEPAVALPRLPRGAITAS